MNCKEANKCFSFLVFLLDVNECESSPCMNNATCNDDVDGYTCNCADGFTGTHCETGTIMVLGLYICVFVKCVV